MDPVVAPSRSISSTCPAGTPESSKCPATSTGTVEFVPTTVTVRVDAVSSVLAAELVRERPDTVPLMTAPEDIALIEEGPVGEPLNDPGVDPPHETIASVAHTRTS
jgi:hypothetical protein